MAKFPSAGQPTQKKTGWKHTECTYGSKVPGGWAGPVRQADLPFLSHLISHLLYGYPADPGGSRGCGRAQGDGPTFFDINRH